MNLKYLSTLRYHRPHREVRRLFAADPPQNSHLTPPRHVVWSIIIIYILWPYASRLVPQRLEPEPDGRNPYVIYNLIMI